MGASSSNDFHIFLVNFTCTGRLSIPRQASQSASPVFSPNPRPFCMWATLSRHKSEHAFSPSLLRRCRSFQPTPGKSWASFCFFLPRGTRTKMVNHPEREYHTLGGGGEGREGEQGYGTIIFCPLCGKRTGMRDFFSVFLYSPSRFSILLSATFGHYWSGVTRNPINWRTRLGGGGGRGGGIANYIGLGYRDNGDCVLLFLLTLEFRKNRG